MKKQKLPSLIKRKLPTKGKISASASKKQMATEKIKKENQQLRDAIKRRTIELESKNKELEIEASLERVRAVAMAMRKPKDLLQICESLFNELQKLGFSELRNAMINVYDDSNSTIFNYDFSYESGLSETFFKNNSHPVIENFIKEIRKTRDAFVPFSVTGKKLNDFIKFRKSNGEKTDSKLKKATALHYYFYSIGNGSIGISTFKTIPDEQVKILKRFRNVFEIAYQRYTDISRAEAQAREAQIETALERVRSRSMAMQKSEELKEVIQIVFDQFVHLNINLDHAGFVVDYKPKGDWHFWVADKQVIPSKITHPYFDSVWAKQFNLAKEKGGHFFSTNLNFKEKNKFYQDLFKYVPELPEKSRKFYFDSPGLSASTVLMENVGLYIENFSATPYTEEENAIIFRFGKAFEQAYTRFLDLQKAEAQAREAQIEAALERVRAASMAMHKSDELKEAAAVLYKELRSLNIGDLFNCGYVFVDEKNNLQHAWMTNTDGSIRDEHIMPLRGDKVLNERYEKWKNKAKLFSQKVGGEILKKHHAFVVRQSNQAPSKNKSLAQLPDPIIFYCGNFSDGYLHILSREELSKESESILSRFTKVFEQTYTRFLDLQKAEEQAREAQIEVSLERVRSKAMAMHKTDDFTSVVLVVFNELDKFQMGILRCGIGVMHKKTRTSDVWTISKSEAGANVQTSGDEPMDIHPLLQGDFQAWLRQDDFSYILKGKDLKNYYRALQQTNFHLPESDSSDKIKNFQRQYYYMTPFEAGTLFAFRETDFSSEAKNIMSRFAKVFNLTYKRFLDLQKAEAQTREAQIEAALERVRSQTMAMHNSEDVGKCIVKMFSELTALGVDEGTRFGIGILNQENENIQLWTARKDGEEVNMHIGHLDMSWHPLLKSARKAWKEQVPLHQYVLEGEDLLNYYQMINNAPDYKLQVAIEKLPERELHYGFIFEHGFFYSFSPREFQPELIQITKRFTSQFGQTYRRYLDLVRAEAQAREAQIEAALEKVRSRSLGMHKSEELEDVIMVVSEQLQQLQFKFHNVSFGFNSGQDGLNFWLATPNYLKPIFIEAPFLDNPAFTRPFEVRKKGDDFNADILTGEETREFGQHMIRYSAIPDEDAKYILNAKGYARSQSVMKHTILTVGNYAAMPYTNEQNAVIKRFGNVFEQSYTRFLDLQKAEAQAREAQIEAALEKVRSRTMAMHHSEELAEVVFALFEQMHPLGLARWGFGLWLIDEVNLGFTVWFSAPTDRILTEPYYVPLLDNPVINKIAQTFKEQSMPCQIELRNDEKRNYDLWLFENTGMGNFPEAVKENILSEPYVQFSYCPMRYGLLQAIDIETIPDANISILQRFAKVFEQTYTRFLDLKKSEAQAREAQIELALERIRAKVTAMRESTDLLDIVVTMRTEFVNLNHDADYFWHMRWLPEKYEKAMTSGDGTRIGMVMNLPRHIHGDIKQVADWESSTEPALVFAMDVDMAVTYIDKMIRLGDFQQVDPQAPTLDDIRHIGGLTFVMARTTHGEIGYSLAGTVPNPPQDAINTLVRFAVVFDLAYKRFEDLQFAEHQHKEAQIELALERVRSRTMAMQRSDELSETAALLFQEFKKLGDDELIQVTIGIYNEDQGLIEFNVTSWAGGGEQINESFNMSMEEPTVLKPTIAAWKLKKKSFVVDLMGEELEGWVKYRNKMTGVTVSSGDTNGRRVITISFFSKGHISISSPLPLPEKTISTLERFASVFDGTYTRFLDLQKAEAQAKEAVKQSSLDRIRGEIASMRTTKDLDRITPLIWKELTTLNIPFIRCGVFIMDNTLQQIHTFLSTPDGKAIAAFHLSYDAPSRTREILAGWMNKQAYIEHWDESAFSELGDLLVQQGVLPSKDVYLETIPSGGLYLHCLPFMQGMLYVGNTIELKEDDIQLLQSVAEAFATAYARYEDFNKLEVAKQQVDIALHDLKQTQQQLIQSEKMASLGELTAGIAHEIQNPLNFVNNFSEVSTELVSELNTEIDRGNTKDVKEIANDLTQNLEKINYHGKRAADIVKGMLQHSSKSSGVKEPTDINALCDEYLRLAYHGLRAKDKSFKAKFETNFDSSLPKLNVVPQDISRVVLNLINNAFYAVNEKAKLNTVGYEPKVIVSTRHQDNKVLISVNDNGNGIPHLIKEKIFQPFFTTKPTGQGTGLGLSLSYDIIKAHGGELSVDTKEGAGTSFYIELTIT